MNANINHFAFGYEKLIINRQIIVATANNLSSGTQVKIIDMEFRIISMCKMSSRKQWEFQVETELTPLQILL